MDTILALDQGTTSSRALLITQQTEVAYVAHRAFPQYFPEAGWVEHDPYELALSQIAVMSQACAQARLRHLNIKAIGISNQRETTLAWSKSTGMPLSRAIVWQCRRSAEIVTELTLDEQIAADITERTGLIPDAYFSASKITWLLRHNDAVARAAAANDLCLGTVDTWLIYLLTGRQIHATDVTNASRTMLCNIQTGQWDPMLCELFSVPIASLPEIFPSAHHFGDTASFDLLADIRDEQIAQAGINVDAAHALRELLMGMPEGISICGVAGDQQAALFGQCATRSGQAKNTYGTGCFMLMHTGSKRVRSSRRLLTTVAASAPGIRGLEYALEGSVFMAGATIQWLRDELGLISTVEESETYARSVPDTNGVYVVPAFVGMGAPYWDAGARGAIYGLTRGATKAHIIRAALESLAYQTFDVLEAMELDAECEISSLSVDGGASRNNFLMQFQADLLGLSLERPDNAETTGAGVAYLAGLMTGMWSSMDEIRSLRSIEARFEPHCEDDLRMARLAGWHECIARTRSESVR